MPWPDRLLLIVITTFCIRYAATTVSMNVYDGHLDLYQASPASIPPGQLVVGRLYTLEIAEDSPTISDYFLRKCELVGGEQFVANGCLICTNVFNSMIETTAYMRPNTMKRSLIHFTAMTPNPQFVCNVEEYPPGMAEMACKKALPLVGSHNSYVIGWPVGWGGGWPWWAWLLLGLLLLLLLLCCCCLLAALLIRSSKGRQQRTTNVQVTPLPMPPPIVTRESKATSISLAHQSDAGSGQTVQTAQVGRESRLDSARVVTTQCGEKVEVFAGHAGVYDVRSGAVRSEEQQQQQPHYAKRDGGGRGVRAGGFLECDQQQQQRAARYSERFSEHDRQQAYHNHGYDAPEMQTRAADVNCISGYDEMTRYHTDREVDEYVERNIFETYTSRRGFQDDMSSLDGDRRCTTERRHHSIPV